MRRMSGDVSMRIRPSDVNAVRGVFRWALRGSAVFLVTYALYLIGGRLFFGAVMMKGQVENAWSTWNGTGADHGMARGVPMLLIGLALVVLNERIARWVVAVPPAGCPGCGYAGSGRDGRCPECGLEGVEGDGSEPTGEV